MKISIIVPCLNEEEFIRKTLEHLISLKGDFELVVVDGGSIDKTPEVVKEFDNVALLSSEKGRAIQMNTGAKHASGQILLFLHADTFLPQNAYDAIVEHFNNRGIIGGSFFLEFDKNHPVLQFYTWCSKMNVEFFTYGDHAIFVRREIFDRIGGFRNITFMEDVEIQWRLRREGIFRKLNSGVKTSARRFEKVGTFKQMVLNVILVGLFKLGVSPARLKAFYKDHS